MAQETDGGGLTVIDTIRWAFFESAGSAAAEIFILTEIA